MIDAERQIRFLYPPVFFGGSLLWAFYLDPAKRLTDITAAVPWNVNAGAWSDLIAVLAGASGVLIVSGFIISSFSVLVLRLFSLSLG